jgi:hypothetical protein
MYNIIKIKRETLNPKVLRQIGLEIPEILGHAVMCLWQISEVRDILGDLSPFPILHMGINGFKMLLPAHLHLETVISGQLPQ